MAKGKYEQWLTEDNLILLEGWARDGLTDEQLAINIGISTTTLYEWKKAHPTIAESLKRGKEVVDFEVENALLKKAMSGDVTAQIFWLKNRKSKKWRDKPVDTESGLDKINDNIQSLANILKNPVPVRELPVDE